MLYGGAVNCAFVVPEKMKIFSLSFILLCVGMSALANPTLFWVGDSENGNGGTGLVVYTNGVPVSQHSDWLVELIDVDEGSVIYSTTDGFPYSNGGFYESDENVPDSWNGRTVKSVIYNSSTRGTASLAAEFSLETNLIWSVADPPTPELQYDAGVVNASDWEPVSRLLYRTWIESFGESETNVLAHSDVDEFDNLFEYASGANPVNGDDVAVSRPEVRTAVGGAFEGLEYVYRRRRDDDVRGLNYWLELTDDLIGANWTNAGYSVEGAGIIDADFEAVTNRISFATHTNRFIRLRVEFSD
jgi:hypothetical protein